MSLQNIFYVVGIISMTLYTLLLIAVVVLLFYIKKKITDLAENIEGRIEAVKEIANHPRETAKAFGRAVADSALTQAAKFLEPKKKKNS